MPWTHTEPEMERREFVQAALRREESMKVLCQRFGISRKTGCKMLARHVKSGQPCLADISRAPKAHPNQTPPEKEAPILRVRKAHPTWGSKKILWTLDRERSDEDWPARSTVDEMRLANPAPRVVRGDLQPRRSAPRIAASPEPPGHRSAPSTWMCSVSPMCPDKSVTYVPGCTQDRSLNFLLPRESVASSRMESTHG